MARENRLKDGMVLGGLFGLAMTTPKISAFFADFLADTIPAAWQFAGSVSIPIYGVAVGLLIGLVIDKT